MGDARLPSVFMTVAFPVGFSLGPVVAQSDQVTIEKQSQMSESNLDEEGVSIQSARQETIAHSGHELTRLLPGEVAVVFFHVVGHCFGYRRG
jgi:hypothetical protein